MENHPQFRQRLKQLRQAKGMSQLALADLITARFAAFGETHRGCTHVYISKIENNKTSVPSRAIIQHMAAVLETDSDALLSLAGKMSPDIEHYLCENTEAQVFFRAAITQGVDASGWRVLRSLVENDFTGLLQDETYGKD